MKLAKRLVKCPHCEDRLPRGEAIKHTNGRYYHEECYEIATKDSREYKELIDTICRIWGIEAPTMQMVRQLKLYRDDPELKCTNKGMQLTLEYYYDILDNKPRDWDGVGIIPYYYDEAKEQYIQQLKINESFDELKKKKEITVYVSPNRSNKNKKTIDIKSI